MLWRISSSNVPTSQRIWNAVEQFSQSPTIHPFMCTGGCWFTVAMDNSTIPTSYLYSLLIVEKWYLFWHLVAEIWDLVVKLGLWGGGEAVEKGLGLWSSIITFLKMERTKIVRTKLLWLWQQKSCVLYVHKRQDWSVQSSKVCMGLHFWQWHPDFHVRILKKCPTGSHPEKKTSLHLFAFVHVESPSVGYMYLTEMSVCFQREASSNNA